MKVFLIEYLIPILIAFAMAVSLTYYITEHKVKAEMFEANALVSYKEDKAECEIKWGVPCVIVKHYVYGIQYYSVDPYDPPKN